MERVLKNFSLAERSHESGRLRAPSPATDPSAFWHSSEAVDPRLLFSAASDAAMDAQWLYGSIGYASLGSGNEIGVFLRLMQLTAGVVGTVAILTLIPRQSLLISPMGARSLSAYLLHGFLVKFAVAAGLFGVISALPDALLLPLVVVLTLVCALLLCTSSAHRLLRPVIAPRWLEKRLWNAS